MQPGVHPNGLFWTTEIPWNSVYVNSDQTRARLILRDFPLVDTIEFGALTAVNGAADIRVGPGRTLRIRTVGNAPGHATVKRVEWNNQPLQGHRIAASTLLQGGTLTFIFTAQDA